MKRETYAIAGNLLMSKRYSSSDIDHDQILVLKHWQPFSTDLDIQHVPGQTDLDIQHVPGHRLNVSRIFCSESCNEVLESFFQEWLCFLTP